MNRAQLKPTEELGESVLGTQKYWDGRYKEDLRNFKNHGYIGDVWFGEDIVKLIIHWLVRNIKDKSMKIIDLGSGNGMLLIELFKVKFTNLTGIDYSPEAIKLATEIAKAQECDITFEVGNILDTPTTLTSLSDVDVILDKGTYDAISLSTDAQASRTKYIQNVYDAMKPNSLFLITSCNWTKEELRQQFTAHFVCVSMIPTPVFKFGGKTGSLVAIVIFKKKVKVHVID